MISNRPMVCITATEDKGFLITVMIKEIVNKNAPPYNMVNLSENIYIARDISAAMEIVKYHTEVMLGGKE
jgi:hypothetical protein